MELRIWIAGDKHRKSRSSRNISNGGFKTNGGKMEKIAPAFIKAKRAFAPALKTSTNPHFKSKYADLAGCMEAVSDALLDNGIAVYQETFQDDSGVTVETVFLHESGEAIRCGKLHVPAAKQDPQGYGSALTYCRRYSLMAACGIAPEDDDGNAASKTPTKPAAVKPEPKGGDPEPDAVIVAQFNAAQDVAALTKVMNSLPQGDRRLYTGHFNARMEELKKAA
jgi:hypothetical protein